jgi:hypothetical protein
MLKDSTARIVCLPSFATGTSIDRFSDCLHPCAILAARAKRASIGFSTIDANVDSTGGRLRTEQKILPSHHVLPGQGAGPI